MSASAAGFTSRTGVSRLVPSVLSRLPFARLRDRARPPTVKSMQAEAPLTIHGCQCGKLARNAAAIVPSMNAEAISVNATKRHTSPGHAVNPGPQRKQQGYAVAQKDERDQEIERARRVQITEQRQNRSPEMERLVHAPRRPPRRDLERDPRQGGDEHRAHGLHSHEEAHAVVMSKRDDEALQRAGAHRHGKQPMPIASEHQRGEQEPQDQRTDHEYGKRGHASSPCVQSAESGRACFVARTVCGIGDSSPCVLKPDLRFLKPVRGRGFRARSGSLPAAIVAMPWAGETRAGAMRDVPFPPAPG